MKGRDGSHGKEKNQVNMNRSMGILQLGCLELREAKYNAKQGCYSFLSGDPTFELDKPDGIK